MNILADTVKVTLGRCCRVRKGEIQCWERDPIHSQVPRDLLRLAMNSAARESVRITAGACVGMLA